MAPRPRIGVTGSGRRWAPSWWCASLALRLAGGCPERISTRHPASGKPLAGLLIGGGNDISTEHDDSNLKARVKLDPARDRLEIGWINHALENHLPLLGICRGAQLINVVLGGSLHQDVRHLRKKTYNRPGLLPTKQVFVKTGSKLQGICLSHRKLRVNSLHHQAVRTLGKDLQVVGKDLDNLVQALEDEGQGRIIGVQWHPEYLLYLPAQFALFRWLVRTARR